MGFWELLVVASMPVVQVMIIGLVGALLAGSYFGVLSADARKHMNKVVYMVFTPSLMFASLAKTVTLNDIISWWFMPVNIGVTFLIGGSLGWIVVKLLRPQPHLRGLVIAVCSAGNLGNLMLIVLPAICNEAGGPFGETELCRARGLSYSSFSMALGGFYIWTHTYKLMKNSGKIYRRMAAAGELKDGSQGKEKDLEAPLLPPSTCPACEAAVPANTDSTLPNGNKLVEVDEPMNFMKRVKETVLQITEELLSPPIAAAVVGFVFGATPWLKSLVVGAAAPFRAVYDAIDLMGNGTIPSITLILGGNLTQGLRKSKLKLSVILAVLVVKTILLPASGIAVIEAVYRLGFLPADPLFRYTLLLQYTIPPAMAVGTMAELFDVAREECSVLLLWTYVPAAFALTLWSSVYLWILS